MSENRRRPKLSEIDPSNAESQVKINRALNPSQIPNPITSDGEQINEVTFCEEMNDVL